MKYPVEINQDGDSFVVSFPDIPEALTCGDSLDDARSMARDALVTALEFYFEDQRPIPVPSHGEEFIAVPAIVWSKVLLLNAMLENRVSQSELARRIGITRQAMQNVVNLRHNTKLDTIEAGLNSLGKCLEISAA